MYSPKWNNKNKRCDYCINHLGEGEKACNLDDDTAVYICQNGKFVESEACIGQNLCVDGKCSCALKNIGCGEDGLILDEETCTCVCPADKPVWDGSECVKEECENVNDCQEEFPDMSITDLANSIERYRKQDTWNETTMLTEDSFNHLQDIMIDYGALEKKVSYQTILQKLNLKTSLS